MARVHRTEAIEKFNQPDYITYAEDGHERLYWFSLLLQWRQATTNGSGGDFYSLKNVDDLIYEVKDQGRVLQKCTPDAQAKWTMHNVDDILLGAEDGKEG
jgi:hypothetical protein